MNTNPRLADEGVTGQLSFSFTWSESLSRHILVGAELIGGNIVGASHEFLADNNILVKTPSGYQIDGHDLRYIGEAKDYPKCSLFEVAVKENNYG